MVALGAVIEGETDHYEHVARETASGLAAVARETGVPVAFGVLTVRQEKQARQRSAAGPDNKGAEAARAAVMTALALRAIRAHLARPPGGGPADGTTDEGARVRLPAPLPVGDHGRSDGAGDRTASGGCARARRTCARWPSAWPAGAQSRAAELDGAIAEAATHWRLDRIAPVDRTILRLGAYELAAEAETPAAVILDEAVELAKRFGEADSPSFVNGVLDAIRRRVRDGQG